MRDVVSSYNPLRTGKVGLLIDPHPLPVSQCLGVPGRDFFAPLVRALSVCMLVGPLKILFQFS